MADSRNPFSEKEDAHLVRFLAKNKPEPRGRLGNAIYQELVDNVDNKWPWAKSHTWQSWRERYKKNQDRFDHKIRLYQKKHAAEAEPEDVQEGPSRSNQTGAGGRESVKPPDSPRKRTLYTESDDEHLADFLATRGSDMGRLGNSLYKMLVEEAETLPWTQRHSWQSWRERYKNNQEKIERLVSSRKKQGKNTRAVLKPTQAAAEASTSKSKGKGKEIPAQPIPQAASVTAASNAPQASSSKSKGKERQTEVPAVEPQQDRSTHIETNHERTTGPAKSQRVRSVTPAPAKKASQPQPKAAPPLPSNAKGKQKETVATMTAARGAVPGGDRQNREISMPPIAIKAQEESDRDVDMHSLFGSDDDEEEVDELEDSQNPSAIQAPAPAPPLASGAPKSGRAPAAPRPPSPPPQRSPSPERILVPSSSQLTPSPPKSKSKLAPAPAPAPQVPAAQPLRKKPPPPKPRLSHKDENIFVSSDAEPSSSSSPHRAQAQAKAMAKANAKATTKKSYAQPPRIVEGPYRSRLKRVRSRVESDSDSDEGPVKRARWEQEKEKGAAAAAGNAKGKKTEKVPREEGEERQRQKLSQQQEQEQEQTKENIHPDVSMSMATGSAVVKKGTAHLRQARKSASQSGPPETASTPAESTLVKAAVAQSTAGAAGAAKPQKPVKRPQAQENAVASSSRVRLSDLPPRQQETPIAVAPVPTSHQQEHLSSVPQPILRPRSSLKGSATRRPRNSSNGLENVLEVAPRRDSGVVISPGADSEADFFSVPPTSAKNQDGGLTLDHKPPPPRIDLRRETINRRQSHIHSVAKAQRAGSHTSTSSNLTPSESRRGSVLGGHRTGRMSVASEDAISVLLELAAPVVGLAAAYSVPDAHAIKIFHRVKSLKKTEVVLFALSRGLTEEEGLTAYKTKKTVKKAKQALAVFAQSKKMLEEEEEVDEGEEEEEEEGASSGSGEEEMPSGLVLRNEIPSAVKGEKQRQSVGGSALQGRTQVQVQGQGQHQVQAAAPSTKRPRKSRPSLIIRRIPSDQEEVMSDYVPPKSTRAAQYARLQRQGRVQEAKEREMHSILMSETQSQYQQMQMRMHAPTVSPSPLTGREVQDVSQMMVDDEEAMRVDETYHAAPGGQVEVQSEEGEEEEEEEVDHGSDQDVEEESEEDVFVDAEEPRTVDVIMVESSDEEDPELHSADEGAPQPVEDVGDHEEEEVEEDEEEGEEDDEEQSVENQEEEVDEADGAMAEEEASEEEDAAEAEFQDEDEDNGIFANEESGDELEEQYHSERATSATGSDFDPADEREPSLAPVDEEEHEAPEEPEIVEEANDPQQSGMVDEDDDDIYMPESLEMPYPGQPQRQDDTQDGPEPDDDFESKMDVVFPSSPAPGPSTLSQMRPSSLPSLATFEPPPDKTAELAAIAETHKKLALNATADDFQALKNFEEEHTDMSDMLRLWSIKWAKALTLHHPRKQ